MHEPGVVVFRPGEPDIYDLWLTNMNFDDLSPEQQRRIEADAADFERQLVRVSVDLRAASPHLHEREPPRRRAVARDKNSESHMISFSVDHSGILETLRQLPDRAGTLALVAAYNAGHPDWRDRPSKER